MIVLKSDICDNIFSYTDDTILIFHADIFWDKVVFLTERGLTRSTSIL